MASYLLSRWHYAAFDDEVSIDDEVSYLADHVVAVVVDHEVVVVDQAVEVAVHVVVVVDHAVDHLVTDLVVAFSVDLVSVLVVLALIDADFVAALNCFYQMVELFAFGFLDLSITFPFSTFKV